VQIILQMMDGSLPLAPDFYFTPVHVHDTALAHILALETPQAQGRYIVADETTMSMLDIARECSMGALYNTVSFSCCNGRPAWRHRFLLLFYLGHTSLLFPFLYPSPLLLVAAPCVPGVIKGACPQCKAPTLPLPTFLLYAVALINPMLNIDTVRRMAGSVSYFSNRRRARSWGWSSPPPAVHPRHRQVPHRPRHRPGSRPGAPAPLLPA